MTTYRCRDCGYFLAESSASAGTLRIVCRRCRRSQTIRFGEPQPEPKPRLLTPLAA